MNDEARKIKAAQEELLKEKEELSKMKKEAQAVKNERVKELDKLRAEEKEVDKVVKNLQRNKTTYQKQLAAKKKQINALNKEIERILAAAVKQSSSSSSSKKSAPVDYKLAEEFSKNKGKLPWPADGPVVGRFGKQFHPVFKNLELPPNNGVDIATSKSAGVQAVFKGVVKQVFVMPGYNQCVLISHGNYFTFYCKLKTVNVKAGDKVSTGETIGKVDTINGETQLHFEVWQNTKPQNPETWLR
jgi:septal ring factor EnvC (AmiA/AmiB activator)